MPPTDTTISAEALQALCQAQAQENLTLRMMLTEERMQKAALRARVAELEVKYEPKTIAQTIGKAEREEKASKKEEGTP